MGRQPWQWEATDRWLRAERAGIIIADSTDARLMIESPGEVDYYFPLADVRQDLLVPSDYVETSGYRGTRKFWHLEMGDERVKNAAWRYEPKAKRPDFDGYIAFKWKVMDHWFVEEEEIQLHPRNPYHRVDYRQSSRHVEVFFGKVKVAETEAPLLVFETSLPTRYYIPDADVDASFLHSVDSHTHCPYKGDASYYNVHVDGERYEDVAWYYPEPLPEAPRLRDKIAFWPEKDDRIQICVNGEPV